MDAERIHELVDDLAGDLDKLEAALAPLLDTALAASTSKLPLLDKAKLYVLATYALEALLFSALRLHGADAKAHPVFQELARVKEYFAKIKAAEEGSGGGGGGGGGRLNKAAARRIVKHGVSGNERRDAQREAKRRAARPSGTHKKFEDEPRRAKKERVPVVKAADVDSSADED